MSIAARAIRGVAWNMVTGVGTRVLGLVGTLILTHFIAPYEYGEVSAASICVLTANQFSTAAFGQYLIATRAPANEAWHAAVLHATLGACAQLLVLALATPLGHWLDAPEMGRFIPGFALANLIERLQLTPMALLQRDMRFRASALTRGVGEIAFVASALATAPSLGPFAIVVGNLVRASLVTTILWTISDRSAWLVPGRIRWSVCRKLFGYGLPAFVGNSASFVATRWDNLLVSGLFGPGVMGRYALAYNLADTPTSGVADQIGDVLLPSFAQMDQDHRRKALLRSASLMALLIFPLSVGLGAVAPTVVETFFDAEWHEMWPMLAILSIISVVKPVTWTMYSFAYAQQRTNILMIVGVFKAAAIVGSILTLGRLGPLWTCAAVGVAHALYLFLFASMLQVYERVPAARMLLNTVPPLLACAPMVGAVLLVRPLVDHLTPGVFGLAAEVSAGALGYVVGALLIARGASRDFLNLARNALRRG